jgi:hypothetical protein
MLALLMLLSIWLLLVGLQAAVYMAVGAVLVVY